MKKPLTLRRHLEASVPHLKRHPDKLSVWIDQGSVASKLGRGLSFEWRYTLTLLFTDFVDSPDTLVVPLLAWIAQNQYDLLTDPEKRARALTFESEVIDHDKIDIQIKLQLSERVIVTATAGVWTCEHVDEPPLPETDGPTGWTLYAAGDIVTD